MLSKDEHRQLNQKDLHLAHKYGLDDKKSSNPQVGWSYWATDTKKLYMCAVAGTWVSAQFS